ncbi:hypothetical protein M153_4810002045 [Pseudoloma neurophilia]|uniref:Uncharacterized protein n=1 Tax=Pseudoloma neurophilia TaxID=146866 RepID=A0A0R0M2W1_9MICR|nr:hypothetical protein M153_4810002045 [Pseudoloma neurophilia]
MRFHILTERPSDISEYVLITDEDLKHTEPSWRSNDTKYILDFIDGRVTLIFYKKAEFLDNIFFIVKNIEYFKEKFEDFCDFEIIYHTVNTKEQTKDPLVNYSYADKDVVQKPPLFQTIITSLLRPDLYLSSDENCKIILETIKDGKVPEESETLQSLIIFGAITKTEKGFKINF